jgi:hypothetical protein
LKIVYFNCIGNRVSRFNTVFEEIINGLSFNKVDCKLLPKLLKYNDVKDYDIILFDPLYYYQKEIHYGITLENKLILQDKKVGMFSLDYWKDLAKSNFHLQPDFLIYRHSSCKKFIEDEEYRNNMTKSINYKNIGKTGFKIDFENIFFSPFTINKDLTSKSDRYQKKYDICLGGNISDKNYPIRKELHRIIHESKYNLIDPLWKRAGSTRNEGKGIKHLGDHDYYSAIAQSWLTLTTTGLANISVRKHYEVCALGSTCLGNHTGMEDHELIKQNTIELFKQEEFLLSKPKFITGIINEALKNKEKLIEMSNSVKQQVREQYDYKVVGKKLIDDIMETYSK